MNTPVSVVRRLPSKVAFLLCATAVACSASAPGEAPSAASSQAVTLDGFEWVSQGPTVQLVNATDYFCYLSSVTGDFDSASQRITLDVQNGFWMLGGSDSNHPNIANQRAATARRTSWSDFTNNPGAHTIAQAPVMSTTSVRRTV